MNKTPIEWSNYTTNPLRAKMPLPTGKSGMHVIQPNSEGGCRTAIGHYCEKISPGCKFCYSSKMQPRFGMPQFPEQRGDSGIEVYLDEDVLAKVLKHRKPGKVFWCDMTDMFGDWVREEWLDRMFAVMALTPHLTHQVLTKRSRRMREYMSDEESSARIAMHMGEFIDTYVDPLNRKSTDMRATAPDVDGEDWPLPNVHLGVSAEDQPRLDERVPDLLATPAAVRFLSLEPLLESLRLNRVEHTPPGSGGPCFLDILRGKGCSVGGSWDYAKIDWVIVGGESGPNARPCNIEWIRDIVRQCKETDTAVLVKQFGANVVGSLADFPQHERWVLTKGQHTTDISGPCLRDRKGGDMSEWPEDLRVREFPE